MRTLYIEQVAGHPGLSEGCHTALCAVHNFRAPRIIRLKVKSLSIPLFPLLLASSALAQTPDAGDLAEGMRLYLQKGNCQACHGWAGDGRKMDSQMPDGANLRESKLPREALVLTIKCGRPGRSMPAFDKFAYSDGRCYGMKAGELKSRGLTLPDPPATLQPREIDLLVDFLLARVVGKGPMDRARCAEYWGSEVEACAQFSEKTNK